MKRVSFFLISALILSSCVGNVSLWGQYQTPTPQAGTPANTLVDPPSTPVDVFVTEQPTLTPTVELSPTATSLLNAFITQPPTSTLEPATPTIGPNTILYHAQSGDWLPAVASRFGVDANDITSPKPLSKRGFIDPGTLLMIPNHLDKTAEYTSSLQLIPDSEIVFSATAVDFNIEQYVNNAGGYLATYRQYLGTTAWTTGSEGISRLAYENSINPRLLLALLDYEAQWVRGKPVDDFHTKYPMGYENYLNVGMFGQMTWAINMMFEGYYGWRSGTIHQITFSDGKTLLLDPTLNAGTVAVMFLFAQLHTYNEWLRIMDQGSGFPAFYAGMFGDPWARAARIVNFFPPGLTQPQMSLPFEVNTTWAFTGGPHNAWAKEDINGPLAALDFAPRNDKSGCVVSTQWILAMAPGLVVRSGNGVVVVDLDGDGHEQTGWDIMYLHVATQDRVPLGTWVNQDDHIGHASCEGGEATGTHTHIARKYNGEWMIADGPIPFVLSGWTAVAGDKPYFGKLIKGNRVVTSDMYGQAWSLITRDDGQ